MSSFSEMSYQQAIGFVFSRLNFERTPDAAESIHDFKLTRMQDLLERLGNPQEKIPCVHIAGTKGKGSTSTMVARIAETAGKKVGLFTSPHVNSIEERFTVNGQEASHGDVVRLIERIRPVILEMDELYVDEGVTFFEVATVLGWLHFEQQQVDLAVMEVGLGGRLDSTNVCRPLVTCITSISFDHTRLLGNTLSLIAAEKAGIIKPGIPVVTAEYQTEAEAIISQVAAKNQAPLLRLGSEFEITNVRPQASEIPVPACYQFQYEGRETVLENVRLSLPGIHQTRNASLAVTIALKLREQGVEISDEDIRQGLLKTSCPLRIEVVSQNPLTIIDAAHNAASIAALCETLSEVNVKRRRVLFATSKDKDLPTLLKTLDGSFDEIWLTKYSNNPRAVPLSDFEEIAPALLTKPWKIFGSVAEALSADANDPERPELFCITGSFFLAAEAKAHFTKGTSLKNS